ncbi:MAG: hypothetical protein IIB39_03980 [Candidatus Marinimicrobia bacterium]|nr:hypothetical protein [Candidatus Neomarinimicrobiota bacterium]
MKLFVDKIKIKWLLIAILLGTLIITLSCETIVNEATITGTVINGQTFQPLVGTFVRAFGFAESALTDSAGAYELLISIDLPDVSEATLEFSKSGFITDTLNNVGLDIGNSVTAPPITLFPVPTATTSGTVVIEGNAVNALTNENIEGAFVRVLDHESDGTLTDANGHYVLSFSIVVGDSISVTVEISKATFLPDKVTNVAISFADTVKVRTANLIPISSVGGVVALKGKVVNAITAAPLEGALIRALKHPETTLSDSSGSYILSVTLDPGQINVLTLDISKESFAPDTLSSIGVVVGDTVNAPPASLIPLVISQGLGGIRGTVINGITEAPIEGAFVRTLNHPESALTDAQGNYAFAVKITGNESKVINLEIIKQGFLASTLPNLALVIGDTIDVPPTNLLPIDPDGSRAIVKGVVVDDVFFDPIEGVQIRAIGHDETTLSNELGIFTLSLVIKISESDTVDLVFSHEEFVTDSASNVALTVDSTITIAVQALTPKNRAGPPSNAIIFRVSRTSISIKGVGGEKESSEITFQLLDKNDTPLDRFKSAVVSFSLSGPGGGEFISPLTATTDDSGLVRTTLNSGTIAGVVQVTASFDPGTGLIKVKAPLISIHGGQPDSDHFTITSILNIAGLVSIRDDSVRVIVGDKFSNIVRPGTAVSFRTSAGVIQGSAVTDENGKASVLLTSSNPKPLPADSGFVTITAETKDENGNSIFATSLMLWSGLTQIQMVGFPGTFAIADAGSQTFTVKVSDAEHGRPLEGGTSIEVSTTAGQVTGDIGVTLPDTQSRGPKTTLFTFKIVDNNPGDIDPPVPAAVTILVISPNGNDLLTITGSVD